MRVRALVPLPSPSLCGINHYTGPRNVNLRRINTDKYETVQQSRGVLKEPTRPRSAINHETREAKNVLVAAAIFIFSRAGRVAATSSMQGDDEDKAEGTGFLFPPSASLPFAYPPPFPLLPSFLSFFLSSSFSSSFLRCTGHESPRGPRVAHRFRFLEVFSGDPLVAKSRKMNGAR